MSRSNPTENTPHPVQMWMEYKGGTATLSYYDKQAEERKNVPLPFTFIVLDQTNTVSGYNKKMKTGLYANEVRDSKTGILVVKFFAGNTPCANGLWSDIKDSVVARSGGFAKNVYMAYRFQKEEPLKLGCIQMKGCSLGPWFEFTKQVGKAINEKAVIIKPGVPDDSGAIKFTPPMFLLKDISEESNKQAVALDIELQAFLDGYFKRTTDKAPEGAHPAEAPQPDAPDDGPQFNPDDEPPTPAEDDVPF